MTLQLVALYGYDPMNRRILRMVPPLGLDHRYAYDGWREVEQLVPTVVGQQVQALADKTFVWGAQLDELLSYHRLESGSWVGYYATQGRQDNVTALHKAVGGNASLVEKAEYDPYGKASVYAGGTGTAQPSSTVGNPYLFHGRRLDDETGFAYFRNRYLHTGWGRFLTNDPIGTWGDGANLGNGVAFVGNAPTTFRDPMGTMSVIGGFGGGDTISEGMGGGGGDGWTCGTAPSKAESRAHPPSYPASPRPARSSPVSPPRTPTR